MIRARLIFAAATITVAATVANHWPRHRLTDYVDRVHFGRAGQASLARAIAEGM